jgi:hypothetical protein
VERTERYAPEQIRRNRKGVLVVLAAGLGFVIVCGAMENSAATARVAVPVAAAPAFDAATACHKALVDATETEFGADLSESISAYQSKCELSCEKYNGQVPAQVPFDSETPDCN